VRARFNELCERCPVRPIADTAFSQQTVVPDSTNLASVLVVSARLATVAFSRGKTARRRPSSPPRRALGASMHPRESGPDHRAAPNCVPMCHVRTRSRGLKHPSRDFVFKGNQPLQGAFASSFRIPCTARPTCELTLRALPFLYARRVC